MTMTTTPTITTSSASVVEADRFLSTLRLQVPSFIQRIEDVLLERYNLDVSCFEADHVCWRTETLEEYTNLIHGLKEKEKENECALLIESEIGGRMIATFELSVGIVVDRRRPAAGAGGEGEGNPSSLQSSRIISVIEIPSPKRGSPYCRGLEHVEFVIGGTTTTSSTSSTTPMNNEVHQSTFDDFREKYANISWNTKAMKKDINPDISLKLEGLIVQQEHQECSVKFHLMPLAKVIEYEKSIATNASASAVG